MIINDWSMAAYKLAALIIAENCGENGGCANFGLEYVIRGTNEQSGCYKGLLGD
jgi:hypothetical protein